MLRKGFSFARSNVPFIYSQVFKDGTGVCEFVRYEDMKYALKKLDDTKFKSHEVMFTSQFYFNVYKSTSQFCFLFLIIKTMKYPKMNQ